MLITTDIIGTELRFNTHCFIRDKYQINFISAIYRYVGFLIPLSRFEFYFDFKDFIDISPSPILHGIKYWMG